MPSEYFETVKTFLLDLGYAITDEDRPGPRAGACSRMKKMGLPI